MKLFSSNRYHYSALRQLGLLTMQQVPFVKTIFTRAAMGLDVPLAQVLVMPPVIASRLDSSCETDS